MLIGADIYLDWCYSERITSIEGAQGSGKTLLAFKTGQEILQNRQQWGFRYLISNVASDITDSMNEVMLRDGLYLDCVIIFDEIGKYINSKNKWMAEVLQADLRKMNCLMLNPSRNITHTELRKHIVEMQHSLEVIGMDILQYQSWLDRKGSKSTQKFYYVNTKDIKGHYDTREILDTDQGIIEWLQDMKSVIKRNWEEKQKNEKINFVSPVE